MFHIQRERWVLILDEKEIFCGLARSYHFKSIHDVGDTAIKTYLSEKKAISSFISSWWNGKKLIESGRVKAVKVIEEFQTIGFLGE